MTTQNYSEQDDIIVPTNDKFTYRGLDGNDTYILSSKSDTSIDIIDTSGSNTIQLPEWSKIKSIIFTSDAVRITCDDMTTFTINGADKFTYDIGGNETNNEIGKISTFSEFADLFGIEIPSSGQVKVEDDKIVYNDKLAELYSVEVKKEENGNKFYINGELSPDLELSSNKTYVFDQNDSSTSNHPLAISTTKNGTHDGGATVNNIKFFVNGYNQTENEYSNIFSNDTIFDNAFVVFSPTSDDTQLYYYCLFHSGMASDAKILIDGFKEEIVTATLNITNNGASDYVISNKNDPTLTSSWPKHPREKLENFSKQKLIKKCPKPSETSTKLQILKNQDQDFFQDFLENCFKITFKTLAKTFLKKTFTLRSSYRGALRE